MKPATLRPFWYYYGSKFRASTKYSPPLHSSIVEPFAGGAGYSLRYYQRRVTLIEKYEVVAGIWKFLTKVSSREIMSLPVNVEHVDELSSRVAQEAKWLIGFSFNHASVSPRNQLSAGRKMNAARTANDTCQGWTPKMRERVASQVDLIRHWKVIHGDFSLAPDIKATWFVDPPYANAAGSLYVEHELDRQKLISWLFERRGQVIVCENEGADWLPFEPLATMKAGVGSKHGGSKEAVFEIEL